MKINPGDKIRIKDWDLMAEEYGMVEETYLDIPGDYYFTPDMREFCEQVVKVEWVDSTDDYFLVTCEGRDAGGLWFTEGMVAEVINE